jgi:hypothetical protein
MLIVRQPRFNAPDQLGIGVEERDRHPAPAATAGELLGSPACSMVCKVSFARPCFAALSSRRARRSAVLLSVMAGALTAPTEGDWRPTGGHCGPWQRRPRPGPVGRQACDRGSSGGDGCGRGPPRAGGRGSSLPKETLRWIASPRVGGASRLRRRPALAGGRGRTRSAGTLRTGSGSGMCPPARTFDGSAHLPMGTATQESSSRRRAGSERGPPAGRVVPRLSMV